MDQSILISIVLPLYNGAQHICETLSAIAAQDFTAAELIVVDDGCSDKSPEMVREFCQKSSSPILKRLKIFSQSNAGVAAARNHGISKSNATWIALLDQDDLWETNTLACFVKAIQNNPQADWFYVAFKRFYASGKEVLKDQGFSDAKLTLQALLEGRLFIPPSGALIKREVCLAIKGFNSKFIPSDDWDFFIKLSANYKVVYISEYLLKFRSHPSSTAKQQKLKIFKAQEQVLKFHKKLFIAKFGARKYQHRMANILWHIGREFQLATNYKMAKDYFGQALKHNPARTKLIVAWLKAICKVGG